MFPSGSLQTLVLHWGWMACGHGDLTGQMFRETVFITTPRVSSQEPGIQGFPFSIRPITQQRAFGTKPVCGARTGGNLSDPYCTPVDENIDPSVGGGIHHVVDSYFRREHRNDALLEDFILHAGVRTTLKCQGDLLETLDTHALALLLACEAGVSSGVNLPDPGLFDQGRV